MSQMVASMAGRRLLGGTQQPIVRLVGLLIGTLTVLWSLCASWTDALVQSEAPGVNLGVNADLATVIWVRGEALTHALMAIFLAACGWLIYDSWHTGLAIKKWQRRSCRDPLTGVANRRALQQHLRSLSRDRRRSSRFVALMVDLDDFKRLNDCHGHHVGDRALQRVAHILKEHFKRRDDRFIARWGGDEFVIVIPEPVEICAEQVKTLLEKRLRQISLYTAESRILFDASVGFAIGSSATVCELSGLVNAADMTLLSVKRNKRRCPNSSSEESQ